MAEPFPQTAGLQDGGCAPALLHLSSALPSSLSRLGLTFTKALSTPSLPPTIRTGAEVNTHASTDRSPSFRVRAIHFDDVAQDAILVCEDCITLFVPIDCDATAAAATATEGNTTQASLQQSHKMDGKAASMPAVAACLRLGNPNQAWYPREPARSDAVPSASARATTTASPPSALPSATSIPGNCLPKRVPLSAEALRRAASVLVAVPVLALPSSSNSAASASGSGPAAGRTSSYSTDNSSSSDANDSSVMSIVIVECAVLPEGVDFIEPSAIPLARPLKKILCAPNTLRFREAWYPIQFFSWCGPQETVLNCYAHNKSAATRKIPQGSLAAAEGNQTSGSGYSRIGVEEQVDEGVTADMPDTKSDVDYHLLCVSSICVDLLRLRQRSSTVVGKEGEESPHEVHRPAQQPDVSVMMNSGYAVRDPATRPAQATTKAVSSKKATSASAASSTAAKQEEPFATTLLHRYVTRTDWCAYDSRSRVLVCINHTRPDVLKPMEVHYTETRGGGTAGPATACSASACGVTVSLCKWTELTLSESLCASLRLPAALTALPQDPRIARLLHSAVGVFTAYGHTFIYHLPSKLNLSAGQACPCLEVYLYLPHDAHRLTSKPASPNAPGPSSFASAAAASATSHAETELNEHDASNFSASPSDFFKRLTAAASSATASAAPPLVRSGVFVRAGQLSLRELLPSAARSPTSPAGPGAPTAFSPLSRGVYGGRGGGGSTVLSSSPQQHLQLSLQVCDDLILLHNLRTNTTAVYDLAERSGEEEKAVVTPAMVASAGAGTSSVMSSRDFLLWALAAHDGCPRARPGQPASSGGSAALSVSANANPLTAYNDSRDRDLLWTRAVAGDWTSMVSAVAGSVMDFSAAMENAIGTNAAAAAAGTAGSTGVLAIVDARVPQVYPLCCCTITVSLNDDDDDGPQEQRNAPNDSEMMQDVAVEEDEADPTHTTFPVATHFSSRSAAAKMNGEVLYASCVWPGSSRTALVISKHDGAVRRCEVDLAGIAEWLLLLRTSHARPAPRALSNSSSNSKISTGGGGVRRAASAADTAAAQTSAVSASLRQLIAFACRHPSSKAPHVAPTHVSFNQMHLSGCEASVGAESSVESLLEVLRDLTSSLVFGRLHDEEHNDNPQAKSADVGLYGAALRRHVSAAVHAAPSALFACWSALMEGFLLESVFVDRVASLETRRRLAPATASNSPLRCSFRGRSNAVKQDIYGSVADRYASNADQTNSSGRTDITQLQSLLISYVWSPLWADLKRQATACDVGAGSDVESVTQVQEGNSTHKDELEAVQQRSQQQQQQQQQQCQLQRCEDLACGFVRLLRRLGLPTCPALQELLLEVVLRCDLNTGAIMLLDAAPRAAVPNSNTSQQPIVESQGESENSAAAAAAVVVDELISAACRTARRVRELLRQGVLEETTTTARSLLGWWERFRYQLAAAQQEMRYCRPRCRLISGDGSLAVEESSAEEKEVGEQQQQQSLLTDGGCPEAEELFCTAVRLFTLHDQQLEAAEAYRWRHDFATAARILLHVPRDTAPIELCEVHGARRSRSSSTTATPSRSRSTSMSGAAGHPSQPGNSSVSSGHNNATNNYNNATSTSTAAGAMAAASVSHSGRTTPRRTSRLLTWDTLAVAVLDGAWNAVREAEEACYVLAERAAAVARSVRTPVRHAMLPPSNMSPTAISSTEDGVTAATRDGERPTTVDREATTPCDHNGTSSIPNHNDISSPASPASPHTAALMAAAPPQWQLRAAERAVQAAHRLYLFVATTILTMPGLTASNVHGSAAATAAETSVGWTGNGGSGGGVLPSSTLTRASPFPTTSATAGCLGASSLTAAAALAPTAEFNPAFAEDNIRSLPHHLHPSQHALHGGGGASHLVGARHPHYNPISSSVSAGYHAHEVRYLQLRQQVEMDWHHMKTESAV